MIQIMKVTGESLSPFFQPGDFVVILRNRRLSQKLKAGDVIVFQHPVYGKLIKRIESLASDGEELFVLGTNLLSTDSRVFGVIPRRWLIGRVIFHIPSPGSKSS